MASTITSAVATLLLIVSVWVADVVCYHPYADNLDPQSPINTATAWK